MPKPSKGKTQSKRAVAKRASRTQTRPQPPKAVRARAATISRWPVPTAAPSGTATAYPQQARIEFKTSTDKDLLYFLGLNGVNSTYAALLTRTQGSATVKCETFNLPNVNGSAITTVGSQLFPTSGRTMSFEWKLMNATAPLNVAGRVYILRLDQRMALPAAPSQLNGTDNNTFDSVVSTLFTNANFVKPHMLSEYCARREEDIPYFAAHVVDRMEYETFNGWIAPYTSDASGTDAYMNEHAVWSQMAPGKRALTGYAVYIPRTSSVQDLTLAFHLSHYFRWPLQSIGAALHKEIPTAPAGDLPPAPTMPKQASLV